MFTNSRSKKAIVLACLGILTYLLSIAAIAQTAEKVVLTPDTMSQIRGGSSGCWKECVRTHTPYVDMCPSHYCSSQSPPHCTVSNGYIENGSKECVNNPAYNVYCREWGTGYPVYRFYNCYCYDYPPYQVYCETDYESENPEGDVKDCDYDYSVICV